MEEHEDGAPAIEEPRPPRHKGKVRRSDTNTTHTNTAQHKKPKPWDHDGIDHWRVDPFSKDDNPTGLLEESSFAVLFPKYREQYLREVWPAVTRALKEVGIACELNLVRR